ncbi:hypothetical protein HOY80DRAFT_883382 [Tuber brumale]|nr:hypothetical protein HOY80DRAFT_883382 [Tuber brumale]
MADSAPQEPRPTPETPQEPIQEQSPQPSPALSQESADHFDGWQTIGEQKDFYDEQDCLHPSHNLASRKLEGRGDNHVVIFDYSLNPGYLSRVDGNPPVEGAVPSPARFSADHDIFFRVSRNELLECNQFDQIINPAEESGLVLSQGPRLGIIDFAQCYDTSDDDLLNSIGEKLGLQKEGETAFTDAHLQRVQALPGRKRFRTGISLRVPFKEPSELSVSGSSEDRFILFVSFPYFGKSYSIGLDEKSESVRLLDFKRLGVGDPHRGGAASEEGGDGLEGILVHQARYMIFDNSIMATFRSREDGAKNQVPLHRFQERIGAFRAMIHMIANRTDLELPTLEKLQASLCKLEEDIDKMISDAATYEDNQGMEVDPADEQLPAGVSPTEENRKRAREENVRKRKQKRVRDLLTSLNRLSAAFFAAISVAERQIAVLRDIHSIFSTSHRTKTKEYERRYPLRQNPFHKNIIPIPILSENTEQIWPNTLDTIDEVVRERKSFIKKVKGLVENMDIRRKILSGFLKSDQAKSAPSERTAQETTDAMKSTETQLMAATKSSIEESRDQLVQQSQTLSSFTVVTTLFLPLSFCASYLGMDNLNLFDNKKMTKRDFWLTTGPVTSGIVLLTALIIIWKRPEAKKFRAYVHKMFVPRRKIPCFC